MSSFLFYDLETSGVNARTSRIMQFAAQRTDMELNPVGDPYNILIKLTEDILPEPDAILVTGITPQKTLADGISEAEFCRIFTEEIALPDTIFVGFNSVRFDDEFMRFLLWRNFHEPYEWQWREGRSRWDILDLVRMTRALRPDGIKWPFDSSGKASNRLELLSSVNKLDHKDAHDALSDVNATIAVAKLIRDKQTKLFDYLLKMRDKKEVKKLALSAQPFVYSSGKYSAEFEKTTIVQSLGAHPDRQGALVYDLRYDPKQFLSMSAEDLARAWRYSKDPDAVRLPVKALQFNRCPAIAPLGVMDESARKRLSVDIKVIEAHRTLLLANKDFVGKLHKALELLNQDREQATLIGDERLVDAQLYDGFIDDGDKRLLPKIQSTEPDSLSDFTSKFRDKRLQTLLPLYKARNFGKSLNEEERKAWETYRTKSLQKSWPRFASRITELSSDDVSPEKQYLLEELQLYAQSIIPEDA